MKFLGLTICSTTLSAICYLYINMLRYTKINMDGLAKGESHTTHSILKMNNCTKGGKRMKKT